MPQMAPMNWLSLFIIFCLISIMFSSMNYYSTLPQSPKTYSMTKQISYPMNWKW